MLYAVPPDNLDHLGLLHAACNTLDSGRQLVQQGEHLSSVHCTSPELLAQTCMGVWVGVCLYSPSQIVLCSLKLKVAYVPD